MSRYTRKMLRADVEEMNKKYGLKKDGLRLKVLEAYGGTQVVLTGGSLHSACSSVTYGYGSPYEVLSDLNKADSQGWLRNNILRHLNKD